MGNKKGFLLIVVALVIAMGTAWMIKQRMGAGADETSLNNTSVAMDTREVLVAVTPIPAGSFIRVEKHFDWTAWPSDNVHESYITRGDQDINGFNGAVARTDILAGEPVVASRVVKPDEGGFMSAVLNADMRAVSIAVNATSGNAGFIFPGDRVDLILTHSLPITSDADQPGVASETFVTDVRVLAVDQRFNNSDNTVLLARTVTLEVTPRQAEMINVAQELGKISLSLRSLAKATPVLLVDKDGKPLSESERRRITRGTDVSRLIYSRDAETYYPYKVSIVRGGESEEIEFNRKGR